MADDKQIEKTEEAKVEEQSTETVAEETKEVAEAAAPEAVEETNWGSLSCLAERRKSYTPGRKSRVHLITMK